MKLFLTFLPFAGSGSECVAAKRENWFRHERNRPSFDNSLLSKCHITKVYSASSFLIPLSNCPPENVRCWSNDDNMVDVNGILGSCLLHLLAIPCQYIHPQNREPLQGEIIPHHPVRRNRHSHLSHWLRSCPVPTLDYFYLEVPSPYFLR